MRIHGRQVERRFGVKKLWRWAIVLGVAGSIDGHAATQPSIEAFAARARVEDVSISADGRYLAFIETVRGRAAAVVLRRERLNQGPGQIVMGEPDHFHFVWCRWATNTRLLCSLRGMADEGGVIYPTTRLVGVDADGRHMRVLLQNNDMVQGPLQDQIINWEPGKPDTVLIEADEGLGVSGFGAGVRVYGNVGTHGLPAVFELNVVSGRLNLREHARDPIRHWITDGHGEVRLGWGISGTTISYYARLEGDRAWRRLTKFEIFSRENHFRPIAISGDDPNEAYAIAPSDGRDAVWLMDLTDKEDPTLVFAHSSVDVTDPMLSIDGKLIAIRYETDRPSLYCVAVRICSLLDGLKKLLPGKFSIVTESTQDESIYVVRSVSDRTAPTYSLVDAAKGVVTQLGTPRPDLDPASLAPMESITYPARDGTAIPGYLTLPPGAEAKRLPLVLMPHGGPIARDTWRYFFLREFLASRGYAVLQMNFRGSSGYGDDWFYAAHQDWGGLTYDDVVDAGRWAIQQGIADPERVCIVGWSFGGYLALLGAQRNPDLFRCAISIAAISDLSLLIDEGHHWFNSEIREKQIGTDPDKLKRDSPRLHAAEFSVPLLIVHGDRDAQVPYEQSVVMDVALTRAGKAHQFLTLRDADHDLSAESDRVRMLRAVEAFLAKHIGSGEPRSP
jgi:dipeptidyl aminopeptidase/acylaminoacyl peptidase